MFDSQFLQRLEYLSLLSRQVFGGQLLAQRRTKQTGGGVEFADHREYVAGDDLRMLDWKVFARHGDLLLKRFQEEEDLHVYLFLDCSVSMWLREENQNESNTKKALNSRSSRGVEKARPKTINKFDFARQITAALAYIALADLDRVAIIGYSKEISQMLPPTRGKNRILSLLQFLETLETDGDRTDLPSVVDQFIARGPRRGLAVVLSDFLDQEGYRRGLDRLRHHRFEPHVVQIHTPEEAKPTLLGDIELIESETGEHRKMTITERKLREYENLFEQFCETLQQYCRTYGLSYIRASNDIGFDDVLLKMMRTAGVVA
ncbi:MAG: DUF58 domain-containing protein [Planctomycetota bacterium]